MDVNKIAVVILAYADYESLEIALAAHMRFAQEGVKYYILQNGRGTYDTEKTYRVAKRYHYLFPHQVEVVDWIKPQPPYLSIKELLNSPQMARYDYICKTDDDVFPVTKNWLSNLFDCYEVSYQKYSDKLAYVSALVNNHFYGFPKILDYMGLLETYYQDVARDHIVGVKDNPYYPLKIMPKNEFWIGGAGTIEHYPSILKWWHKQTTLNVEKYIGALKDKPDSEFNNQDRFSINCIVFKKELWTQIDVGSTDDEHQFHMYCMKNDKKIVVRESVPSVHLTYNWQREGMKDMLPELKAYYQKWLNLNYPISICGDINYENEARLRWIESQLNDLKKGQFPQNQHYYLFGCILLITKKIKDKKTKYYLFGLIPILKTKEK